MKWGGATNTRFTSDPQTTPQNDTRGISAFRRQALDSIASDPHRFTFRQKVCTLVFTLDNQ